MHDLLVGLAAITVFRQPDNDACSSAIDLLYFIPPPHLGFYADRQSWRQSRKRVYIFGRRT